MIDVERLTGQAKRVVDRRGFERRSPRASTLCATPRLIEHEADVWAMVEVRWNGSGGESALAEARRLLRCSDVRLAVPAAAVSTMLAATATLGLDVGVSAVVGGQTRQLVSDAVVAEVKRAMEAQDFVLELPGQLVANQDDDDLYAFVCHVVDAANAVDDKGRDLIVSLPGTLELVEVAKAALICELAGAVGVRVDMTESRRMTGAKDVAALLRCVLLSTTQVSVAVATVSTHDVEEFGRVGAGGIAVPSVDAVVFVPPDSTTLSDSQLELALEHGRDMFKYHAGQRLTSIRYFVIALAFPGLILQGLLGANGFSETVQTWSLFVISVVSCGLIILFWLLDKRNVKLVETSRRALKAAESVAADRFHMPAIETVVAGNDDWPRWMRYGNGRSLNPFNGLVSILFLLFFSLAVIGVVAAGYRFFAGPTE